MSNILRRSLFIGTSALALMAADKPGSTEKVKTVYQPDPDQPAAKNKGDAIEAYRTMLNDGADFETELSDDQIWAVLKANPGQGDDVEKARLDGLEAINTTEGEPMQDEVTSEDAAAIGDVSITGEASRNATDLGKKISAETQKRLREGVEGAEKYRKAPLVMLFDLVRDNGGFGTYKTDAKPGAGQMWVRSLPRPGTPKKLADGTTDTGGNNPDRIDVTYTKDNEVKTKKVSTYDLMWLATDDGKYQIAERDAWRASLKDKPEGKYVNEPLDTRQTNASKWAKRFTDSAGVIKKAVRIELLIAQIEDVLPNVRVEIKCKRDKDNKLTEEPVNSTKPIYLSNRDENVGAEAISVGSFLQFKPTQANRANGGTVAALKVTSKRASGGGTGADKVPDMATAESWAALLSTGFEQDNWNQQFRKRLNTNTEEGKVQIKTWGDIYTELHSVFGPSQGKFIGTHRRDYEKVCAEMDAAKRKEDEAKAAANKTAPKAA